MVPRPALLAAFVLACAPAARGGSALLENGDLASWADGVPDRWTVSVGATQPGRPESSTLASLPEGGARLSGDARTGRWKLLHQRLSVSAGEHLRLRFTARGVGLRKEAGQFGSAYVGLLFKRADGKIASMQIEDVRQEGWTAGVVHARVPEGTASTEAAVFLSMTGALEVRGLGVERMQAGDSFDVLVEDMDRHYPFFHPHGIDWDALRGEHAAAGRAARSRAEFVAAVRPLLAKLRDPHVWIESEAGAREPAWRSQVEPNFRVEVLVPRLKDVRQVVPNVIAARTRGGYGYLALGTMEGSPADLAAVDAAWRALFDAPGIVLDLRVNGGGDERWGQHLLGCLTKVPLLYGRQRHRAGPAHDSFFESGTRTLAPRADGAAYDGAVVALIGPFCVSSGEGMALMCKALPRVQLLGLPTRGASGSPRPVTLPNGVRVWYSRWISLLPDGTPFERKGIQPDVRVEHVPGEDTTFDAAVDALDRKLSPQKAAGK